MNKHLSIFSNRQIFINVFSELFFDCGVIIEAYLVGAIAWNFTLSFFMRTIKFGVEAGLNFHKI